MCKGIKKMNKLNMNMNKNSITLPHSGSSSAIRG